MRWWAGAGAGVRLGTLDLYRRRPGSLSADEGGLRVEMSYQDVHLTTGVPAAKLRISFEDAFARPWTHAFAERRSLPDVPPA